MSYRAITLKVYTALLTAYRERPGIYGYAARAAKIGDRTAKRGWFRGWERMGYRAIKDVLDEEAKAAKRKQFEEELAQQRAAELERIQARKDASDAYSKEGQIVKLARANALVALANTARVVQACQRVSERLRESLETTGVGFAPGQLTPPQAARVIASATNLVKEGNAAARLALTLERIHQGEPTEIVGVQAVSEMSDEEAVQEIEEAQRALTRARELGLVVIPGGHASGG